MLAKDAPKKRLNLASLSVASAQQPEAFRLVRLTETRRTRRVKSPEGAAMSKFAPSVRQWGSDEFALRLNELLALVVSFLMAGIAMLAFIACAVLQ